MTALRAQPTSRVAAMVTTPAPGIVAPEENQQPTVMPFTRPTSIPDADLELLSGLAQRDSRDGSALPFDLTVPHRVPVFEGFATAISHRAACLLLHVDGSSTLAQIAAHTSLPRDTVFEIFLELLGSGAIELQVVDGSPSTPPSPASGVFPPVLT